MRLFITIKRLLLDTCNIMFYRIYRVSSPQNRLYVLPKTINLSLSVCVYQSLFVNEKTRSIPVILVLLNA